MGGGGEHEGRFSRGPFPAFFLQKALVSSSGMGRDVHSLILSIQHFSSADHGVAHLPHGALKDGVGEAVVAP